MKDNFSGNADKYAKYRPGYPDELISYISGLVNQKECALDVATGNGQLAHKLAEHFNTVMATDISAQQIENATQGKNIIYSVSAAEQTKFDDRIFDLVTVGQAVHWFDSDLFYKEVKRILKPEGIIALIGYDLLKINPSIDQLIRQLYSSTLVNFWDKERRYIDDKYLTIPFPFEVITPPSFINTYTWNFDQLTGYLGTWSAVKHYMKAKKQDPVEQLLQQLKNAWGSIELQQVEFPLLLKIGRYRA